MSQTGLFVFEVSHLQLFCLKISSQVAIMKGLGGPSCDDQTVTVFNENTRMFMKKTTKTKDF